MADKWKQGKDSEYCNAINELIPTALLNTENIIMEKRVKAGMRVPKGRASRSLLAIRHQDYDRIYHREMNRLAREAGLRDL